MHSDCACTGGAPQHSSRRPGLSAIGGCPDSAPGPMAMPLAMLHRHHCQEQTTAAASVASKAADDMLHSSHRVSGSRHLHESEHAGQHKPNLPTNSARSRIKAKRLLPRRQHMQPSVSAAQGMHALSDSVYVQHVAAGTLVAHSEIDGSEAPHQQPPASAKVQMAHCDGGTSNAMDVDQIYQHPTLTPNAHRAQAQDNTAQALHGVKLSGMCSPCSGGLTVRLPTPTCNPAYSLLASSHLQASQQWGGIQPGPTRTQAAVLLPSISYTVCVPVRHCKELASDRLCHPDRLMGCLGQP